MSTHHAWDPAAKIRTLKGMRVVVRQLSASWLLAQHCAIRAHLSVQWTAGKVTHIAGMITMCDSHRPLAHLVAWDQVSLMLRGCELNSEALRRELVPLSPLGLIPETRLLLG